MSDPDSICALAFCARLSVPFWRCGCGFAVLMVVPLFAVSFFLVLSKRGSHCHSLLCSAYFARQHPRAHPDDRAQLRREELRHFTKLVSVSVWFRSATFAASAPMPVRTPSLRSAARSAFAEPLALCLSHQPDCDFRPSRLSWRDRAEIHLSGDTDTDVGRLREQAHAATSKRYSPTLGSILLGCCLPAC